MSKCPFLLLAVGGPTFEDEFAPVFLVHPCVPAVVVLGCPAYVPRVQAPGLIADVVCGYVTSIPGLPICPPADEGHQRDGPALLTLRVSAQGLELSPANCVAEQIVRCATRDQFIALCIEPR